MTMNAKSLSDRRPSLMGLRVSVLLSVGVVALISAAATPVSALEVSVGGISAGASVGGGGVSAGASVGGSGGVNAGASVGGGGVSAGASVGGGGGINAGVGIGGGGVSAGVSIGGRTPPGTTPANPPGTGVAGVDQNEPSSRQLRRANKSLICAKGGNTSAFNGFALIDTDGSTVGWVHGAEIGTDQRIKSVRLMSASGTCYALNGGSFKVKGEEVWVNVDASKFR